MKTDNPWLFELPSDLYTNFVDGKEQEQSSYLSPKKTIREIIYGFSRYQNSVKSLTKSEQAKIEKIASIIVRSYQSGKQPIHTVRLIGHADKDTPRRSNFERKISGDRALEVQKVLISTINRLSRSSNYQVLSSKITWRRISRGANEPVVQTPSTEVKRSRNRRVEIVLIRFPRDSSNNWCFSGN